MLPHTNTALCMLYVRAVAGGRRHGTTTSYIMCMHVYLWNEHFIAWIDRHIAAYAIHPNWITSYARLIFYICIVLHIPHVSQEHIYRIPSHCEYTYYTHLSAVRMILFSFLFSSHSIWECSVCVASSRKTKLINKHNFLFLSVSHHSVDKTKTFWDLLLISDWQPHIFLGSASLCPPWLVSILQCGLKLIFKIRVVWDSTFHSPRSH